MLLEKYHKTVPGPEPKSSTCDGLKFGSRDETYTIPPNSFHKDGYLLRANFAKYWTLKAIHEITENT
jgi:hypothetical protein